MTKNNLIILYCIVDDFIHRFLETSAGKKNLALYYGKRGPKHRMPVAVMKTELQFGLSQGKERGWNVQTLLLQHIRIFASFS